MSAPEKPIDIRKCIEDIVALKYEIMYLQAVHGHCHNYQVALEATDLAWASLTRESLA